MQAVFAAAKLGAKIILLNTSFAGPQIREVALREGTDMLIVDDEYVSMLEGIEPPRGRWRAWVDDPAERQAPDTLASLIAGGSRGRPPRSERGPRVVILTSGTTGTPKGAPRDEPRSLGIIGGILSKVPLRSQETTVLAAPMFHTLGLAGMLLALSLGHTIVVHRRFDPEQTLDALADNGASTMIVVPVMLQRMMELGEDQVRARDLRALRIILSSGSAISADLVRRGMSAFGPVIYNMYGSTEVAEATIATPEDLAVDPTTVGSAVRGHGPADPRRAGPRGARRDDRPDLRRQRRAVRGLHRRRGQGADRRPHVVGRPRPPRRRADACTSTAVTTR